MKTRHIISLSLLAAFCIGFSSCSDDLGANYEQKDELYRQMISFKAPVNAEGIYPIYMRYKTNGEASYRLPVIVSGTKNNGNDINVKIAVDNDTLQILNTERFAVNREDLWYRQLPEQYYSFESNTCRIPAGKDVETYPINFNFTGIDLSEKWVLPLTVVEDPSYKLNYRKGYDKALMYINLFNNFSGQYASNTMNVYIDGETSDPATVANRTCRVVDDSTIFFYAGTIWDEDINRSLYKVNVHFGPGVVQSDGSLRGPVTVTAGHEGNPANIESYGECYYTYSATPQPTKPNIERRIVTLFLNYRYTDITTDPNNPIRMDTHGSMSLERNYNTLIPDEEQAFQW